MDCLTEDTIIEFLQGQLSEEDTEKVERHMDQCQDCRLLVAELARTSFSEHPTPAPASQSKRMFKPVLYAAADGYVIDPNAVGPDNGSMTDPWLMDHRPTFKLRKDDSGATVAEEIDTDPGHPAPMGRLGPGFSRTLPPIRGAGLSESEELQPGEMISQRYRIIQFLGAGAMGTVYEAHDERLDERIALKVLRPELKNVPQLLERLHHEVVLGRRITHPNICRLHDIGKYGDVHFITMELVRGESLDEYLKRGRPAGRLAISLLLQVCNALEAAHQKGVVHRDLKPGNIMIDWTAEPVSIAPGLRPQSQRLQEIGGKVTVMDFGLARDLHGDRSQSGMLIGSPAYWAPEQARGERATEQSDIYAVGVMACELFGGPRPTLGKTGTLSEVAAPYRPAVRRCLQSRPEDRHESAGALRDALVSAARSVPTRRRVTLAAAAAVVVIIAALASYSLLALFEADQHNAAAAAKTVAAPAVVSVAKDDSAKTDDQTTQEQRAEPEIQPPAVAAATVAVPQQTARPARTRARKPGRRKGARVTPRAAAPDAAVARQAAADAAAATARAAAQARMIETIRQRAAAIERHREAKGLLAADLPIYLQHRRKLQGALKSGDSAAAAKEIEQLTLALSRARIDSALVSRKLARLNKQLASRKLDPKIAKQVRETFSKVHARYFAGDYEAANERLNRIWRLLKR